jgi:hypothetical protein
MGHVIKLKLTPNAVYQPDYMEGTIAVTLCRSLQTPEQQRVFPLSPWKNKQPVIVPLWVPSSIPLGACVFVWLRGDRDIINEQHPDSNSSVDVNDIKRQGYLPQRYRSLIGKCISSIEEVEAGVISPLLDVNEMTVGSIRMEIEEVPESSTIFVTAPTSTTEIATVNGKVTIEESLLSDVDCASLESDLEARAPESNIDYLPRFVFPTVPLIYGRAPLWTFPWQTVFGSHIDPIKNSKQEERLLKCHMILAASNLHMKSYTEVMNSPPSVIAEFIGEMQTPIIKSLLYVKDSSHETYGERYTDEWDFPRDDPKSGDDCEGFASVTHELVYKLIRGSFKDTVLQFLQQFDRVHYIPLFCVMGISVGENAYTYHACNIKVDAEWLYSKLGLPLPEAFIEQKKKWQAEAPRVCQQLRTGRYYPAIVLEPTTYTTSCSTFASPYTTKEIYMRSHTTTPVESMSKVPFHMMYNTYHHIQTAICPLLMHRHKITRIDFMQDGKLAASFYDIINYLHSDSITLIPRYYTNTKVDHRNYANRYYECLPHLSPLLPPPSPDDENPITVVYKTGPSITSSHTLYRDAWYRFIDFSDTDIHTAVMKQFGVPGTGSIIEIALIQCTSNLSAIRIREWV